jgi:hypothetical protein
MLYFWVPLCVYFFFKLEGAIIMAHHQKENHWKKIILNSFKLFLHPLITKDFFG